MRESNLSSTLCMNKSQTFLRGNLAKKPVKIDFPKNNAANEAAEAQNDAETEDRNEGNTDLFYVM